MKYTKLMMLTLVVGLLTFNGCMLKHVFSDDESMSHGDGMMMHDMTHSSDDGMDMEDMNDE